MDRPQWMNTLKLLKYLLGTDFSPWGFLFVCFVWYSSYAPVGLSNARGTKEVLDPSSNLNFCFAGNSMISLSFNSTCWNEQE